MEARNPLSLFAMETAVAHQLLRHCFTRSVLQVNTWNRPVAYMLLMAQVPQSTE